MSTVKVIRGTTKFSEFNKKDAPAIFNGSNTINICPPIDSKSVGRLKIKHGLKKEDLTTWFCDYVGIDPPEYNPNFSKEIDDFFYNFKVEIPLNPLPLNVSTVEKEVSYKEGKSTVKTVLHEPEEPKDYITYKILLESPQVAKSKELFIPSKHIAYLVIEDLVEQQKQEKIHIKNTASSLFLDILERDSKNYLYLLKAAGIKQLEATNIGILPDSAAHQLLDKVKDSNPLKFIEVYRDVDGLQRVIFYKCVEYKIMKKTGNKFIYNRTTFNNEEELFVWWNDAENSQEVQIILAKVSDYEEEKLSKLNPKK